MRAILRPFSRCVFRHLSWPGRPPLLAQRPELLRQPVLEIVHDDILPRQVWNLPRYSHLRIFTLPRYFQLRNLYSNQLLPLEESLFCPATST